MENSILFKLYPKALPFSEYFTLLGDNDKRYWNAWYISTEHKLNPSPEVYSPQSDILQRVISDSLQCNPKNILCYGFREPRNFSNAFSNVENYYPNPLLSNLLSPEWENLLNLIGEQEMYLILRDSHLFLKSDSVFVQITGIVNYWLHSKSHSLIERAKIYYGRPIYCTNNVQFIGLPKKRIFI